jgi:hypothetical protein
MSITSRLCNISFSVVHIQSPCPDKEALSGGASARSRSDEAACIRAHRDDCPWANDFENVSVDSPTLRSDRVCIICKCDVPGADEDDVRGGKRTRIES